jgi:hypothetical protein
MKKISHNIEITQDCINTGVRGSCVSCPAVGALERAGFYHPYVDRNRNGLIEWGYGRAYSFRIPANLRSWIIRYDLGGPVEPITFVIKTEHTKGLTSYLLP